MYLLPDERNAAQAKRESTGQTGAPSYNTKKEQFDFLSSSNFNTKEMAEIMGVSRSTVKRRLR